MAGCHNSPWGAFLLFLCSYGIGGQFLKVGISSSHCINDERRPPHQWKPLPPSRHATPPPRFMSARCVRVRTYIAHTLPQGHCRHDEDHSTKKQMKVYKFSKYVFFFLILECKLLISISILCENTS